MPTQSYIFLILLLFQITLPQTILYAETCNDLDSDTSRFEYQERLVSKQFPREMARRMAHGLNEKFLVDILKRASPHVAHRGVSADFSNYDPKFGAEDPYHKIYISSHESTAIEFVLKNMKSESGQPGLILKFLIPNFYRGSNSVHIFTREQFPDDRIFLTDIGLISKEGSSPITGATGKITWINYHEAIQQGIIQELSR